MHVRCDPYREVRGDRATLTLGALRGVPAEGVGRDYRLGRRALDTDRESEDLTVLARTVSDRFRSGGHYESQQDN